jgi:hypothetical protein
MKIFREYGSVNFSTVPVEILDTWKLSFHWPNNCDKVSAEKTRNAAIAERPRIVAAFIRSMVKDAIEEFNRSTA